MPALRHCNEATRRYIAVKQVLSGVDRDGRKIHPGIGDAGVISLAQGNGVRRPHPSAVAAGVRALLDTGRSIETYASHARDARFDAAIARTFGRFGIPRETARTICIDSGLTRLLAGFFFAAGRPGDAYLVNRAFYHGFASLAEACHVRLVALETDPRHGYKLRAGDIGRHFAAPGATARGLILVQPGFTGELYGAEELAALADAVEAHDLRVFADMTFACTEHDLDFFRPALASVAGMEKRVVSAMSASKAFGLANMRIGWACGPAETIEAMNFYATATGLSVPQVAKSMATAALAAPLGYLEENAAEAGRRKRLLVALIAQANALIAQRWSGPGPAPAMRIERVPRAGHCMLVSMDDFRGLKTAAGEPIRTSVDITRYLLSEAKVAVSPCHSGGIDRCLVRLAFGDLAASSTYATSAARERRWIERLVRDSRRRAGRPASSTRQGLRESADWSEGRRVLRVALAERMAPALAALRRVAAAGPDRGVALAGGGAGQARMQEREPTENRAA
ncbi:MAG: pyridoxal phosphate-dependent aminotransferase [Alphaproteobacteria bacterium]|nr:pyridoxal phosphate-dependent aminotransferase [Alphaproteobacteria bacterium]